MSNTTYRAFVEKLGASDPNKFVGKKGELFWDPSNLSGLTFSDGKTAGGSGLSTSNIQINTNKLIDQISTPPTQYVSRFVNVTDFQNDYNYEYGSSVASGNEGYYYVIGGDDNTVRASIIKYNATGGADYSISIDYDEDYTYGTSIAVYKSPDKNQNNDLIYVIVEDDANNTIVLVKYDSELNKQWQRKIYANSGYTYIQSGDLSVDADGNVYIIASTGSEGIYKQALVIKFDTNGNRVWSAPRVIGGPDYNYTKGNGISFDDDYLYITGSTYTEEYKDNGVDTFTKTGTSVGSGSYTEVSGINVNGFGAAATFDVTASSGSYVVTVNSAGYGYAVGDQIKILGSLIGGVNGANDLLIVITAVTTNGAPDGIAIFVAKLKKTDGTSAWVKTIKNPEGSYWYDGAYGIAVGTTGVYVTGHARDEYFNETSAFLAKFDKSGVLLWQKNIASFSYSKGSALTVDSNDNVYLVGSANDAFTFYNISYNHSIILGKFDKNGNNLWLKSFGGLSSNSYTWYYTSGSNNAQKAIDISVVDGVAYLVVTGYSYVPRLNESTGIVARFAADGSCEGTYEDFVVQPSFMEIENAALSVLDGISTIQNISAANISFSNNNYINQYTTNFTYFYYPRSPFELFVPFGTVSTSEVLTNRVTIGSFPFKTSASRSLYIGDGSGVFEEGGWNNIAIGAYAAQHITYGGQNIFLGRGTGYFTTTGYYNTFVGRDAGYYNSVGYENVFLGYRAGYNQSSGDYNVVIGNVNTLYTNQSAQLAIGSDGYAWIRGDSDRNVSVATNGAGLTLTSPDGTKSFKLTVGNDGNLYANGSVIQFAP